uniref:Uncharacterized protein n=1 Tax=Oryza barthii TaxID=65489 RepID=A0A0D3G7S9_9ORYZ
MYNEKDWRVRSLWLLDTRGIILLYLEKLEREKIIKDKFALGSKESKRGPHIAGGFSEFESNLQLLAGSEIHRPAQPLQLRQKRAAATGVLVPRSRAVIPHVPRRQHPPQMQNQNHLVLDGDLILAQLLISRELRCCYKANVDSFSATDFHRHWLHDHRRWVMPFSPQGYRSTDDYYDTLDAFLFYWPDTDTDAAATAAVVLPKFGAGDLRSTRSRFRLSYAKLSTVFIYNLATFRWTKVPAQRRPNRGARTGPRRSPALPRAKERKNERENNKEVGVEKD